MKAKINKFLTGIISNNPPFSFELATLKAFQQTATLYKNRLASE
jgi:hypothetical protein